MDVKENEEKPFWTQFLKTDQEEAPKGGDLASMVKDVLDGKKTFNQAKVDREEDEYAVEIYNSNRKRAPSSESPSRMSTPSSKGGDQNYNMKKEWEKIRKLEAKIGKVNKA